MHGPRGKCNFRFGSTSDANLEPDSKGLRGCSGPSLGTPMAVCSQNPTTSWNQQLAFGSRCLGEAPLRHVISIDSCSEFILSILAVIRVFFRSRTDTAMEVLTLRQQVAVLKRKRARPALNSMDRFFWTILRRLWSYGQNIHAARL